MTTPSFEDLRVDLDGAVATVTIDRPARKNAATTTTWRELGKAFRWATDEPAVRVVVVTGAGDAFCSGADLSGGLGEPDMAGLPGMRLVSDACLALHRLPKPAIARVNGVAAGAGMNLALGCDLIVASSTARFSEIFARRGLSVDFGGSWLLPRLVGLHRAKELVLLADIITADEAERLGLINRVVPPDELDAVVSEWAARLAAGPPVALASSKRMLNDSFGRSMDEALEHEARSQVINLATEDVREAISAFFAKRDPHFQGR
ncbi:MAG: enoyl-CoA hydratase [Actinobacteria bacterium]|nr:enoyl-CoA hydratase [Actinomycetota bacterium]